MYMYGEKKRTTEKNCLANVHPILFKMQSPCNTTCRYKGCMKKTILTMHDHTAYTTATGGFCLPKTLGWTPFDAWKYWQSSQPDVVLPKMWMRNFLCVLQIIRPIPDALPVINSLSENRSHRFSRLNQDSLNHDQPQQLCELISNIKWWRWLGTLVMAKTLAQNR